MSFGVRVMAKAATGSRKGLPALAALLILFSAGCSGPLKAFLPDSIGEGQPALLRERLNDDAARDLFSGDDMIRDALYEFLPEGISAGVYDYGGIMIQLGLARFSNADDACGLYSALAAMPRERWKYGSGEMSYRPPYFAGRAGEYVFWFVSPSNPPTYASFYRSHGETIIAGLERLIRRPERSYQWKILPEENRFSDSLFYVKSRRVMGMNLSNAYAATYQAGLHTARIYVERYESDEGAARAYGTRLSALERSKRACEPFIPMPGAPLHACHWREPSGDQALCRYRWLIFFLNDMPDLRQTNAFVRSMFANMMKIREEVVPVTKKRK